MNDLYYFDYNATHPPLEDLIKKNLENYLNNFYNPSGPTRFSLERQGIIENSRKYFSNLTNKPKDSFIFCTTGTEANHLLIGCIKNSQNFKGKVYVSPFEHSSVYGALDYFGIEPILIETDKTGIVDLNDFEKKIKSEQHPLICIYAANETGVIQPIKELAQITRSLGEEIYSDLMQAFAKIEIDFSLLDGFTFSGHKIGAGMGASVVQLSEKLLTTNFKIFHGGNQENSRRAGTENTFAISCLKDSCEFQLSIMEEKNKRLLNFQKTIEKELKTIGCEIISESSPRLPSTSFLLFPVEDLDFFMLGMEEEKIILSTGSSCKSRAREPAFSLLKMGYSEEEALKAIRISTGYFTKEDEIFYLIEKSKDLVKRLEAFS